MIELYKSIYNAPFGNLYLACDRDGTVFALFFSDKIEDYLAHAFGEGEYIIKDGDINPKVKHALDEYFAGNVDAFANVKTIAKGTDFQIAAWNALKQIPYGGTISYAQQAQNIGNSKAVRAIGGANGRNPISIIVPCHRVIGKSGAITGFGGGVEVKEWLLHHEKANLQMNRQ